MPFSFEHTWIPCDGATKCPCPNHFPSTLKLRHIFHDTIDNEPILHHLHVGNGCPTPAQEDAVSTSLPELESGVKRADDSLQKITQLKQTLTLHLQEIDYEMQRLRSHRDALSSALFKRRQILAPIKRLPPEIFTHIISFTLDYDHIWRRPDDHARFLGRDWHLHPRENDLWRYESVCKRWRTDIISCPSLWSKILILPYFDMFEGPGSEYARYAPHLARHISRAGPAVPLAIYMTLEGFGPFTKYGPLPEEVLSMLKPIAHRIYHLQMALPAEMIRGLYPLRVAFTALKSLEIHNLTPQIDCDGDAMDLFSNAPMLTAYEAVDMIDPLGWYGIPWHRLTRFSFEYARSMTNEIQTALEILQRAQNLTHCSLVFPSQTAFRVLRSNLILCECLTSLSLEVIKHIGANHPIRQVFACCTFPVLKELEVRTSLHPTDDGYSSLDKAETFHALVLCVQRSRCPLSNLYFSSGDIDAADILELFGAVPTLTELEVEDISSGFTDAVIQSLCIRQGDDGIIVPVPALRSLLLEGDLEFSSAVFVGMVKNRWEVAPFCSIKLYCGDLDLEECRLQLAPYEAAGLKLRVE